MWVINGHEVIAPERIVHGDVGNRNASIGLCLNDYGRPVCALGVTVASAVYKSVLDCASRPPELDVIAVVVRYDTVVNIGVVRLGVYPIASVVGDGRVGDFYGAIRGLNPIGIGAFIRGYWSALIIVARV